MAAIGPPVPTVVGSASDPVGAGIVASATDSGRDNLHARVEPERYEQQIRLFNSIVPFRTLGVVTRTPPRGVATPRWTRCSASPASAAFA